MRAQKGSTGRNKTHQVFVCNGALGMTLTQPTLFPERRRKRPPALERRTHIAVADLLRRAAKPDWIWLHVPNGEHRSDATASLLKRMGVMPGAFDFLLIGPDGQHHWLELKRGRAVLSVDQQQFLRNLAARRVPHAIARSFDEAVAALKSWDVLRPIAVQ
jgi:hypothetical protein